MAQKIAEVKIGQGNEFCLHGKSYKISDEKSDMSGRTAEITHLGDGRFGVFVNMGVALEINKFYKEGNHGG